MESGHLRFGFVLCFGSLVLWSSLATDSWSRPNSISQYPPKSLSEAYLAAVKRSETVGIQQELLSQANNQETQAVSALYPTVNGVGSFLNQPSPNNPTGSAVFPSSQTTVKFTANQPLFRGFREFAALRQKKSLVAAQTYNLRTAARQLFYDLAQAYFNVLGAQADKKNYEAELEINQRHLKVLQSFLKIGRSQITDLLTFQSNMASIEAVLEVTLGQLESAKDVLAYLTGWERNTSLVLDSILPNSPIGIDDYLARIEERPEIQSAKANVQANEDNISIASGGHLPSADVLGNYYVARPGVLSSVNWDVQVALTVPIFQGGLIESQVRQAESIARQYGLILSQARRTAEREVRVFFDIYNADLKQYQKLVELVEISKKNYEAETRFYRNGLVTNLDVLQATKVHQDAKRQLDRGRQILQLDAVKLQAATGQRKEVDIELAFD